MFEFSFTKKDVVRVAWTFAQAGLAVVLAGALSWIRDGTAFDVEAIGVAALAAGLAAVKNLFTKDGSMLKG